ncbi:MAG: hypothetical protein GPJ54_18140, partial [Candidatus Heimdallarchaeota archaeon]|nr:hypothetical protein [Candidatus Heimdallarchaeota archaeon]
GTLEATPLATIAEVPQSKVYSYLSSLEKRGIVSKIAIDGKPNIYNSISYEQVISQLQNELISKVDTVEDYFKTVSPTRQSHQLPNFIMVMQGDVAVKNGLTDILNSVKNNIITIPNDYYEDMIERLIVKKSNEQSIKVKNLGNLMGSVLDYLPNTDSKLHDKLQLFIAKRRPYIIFTDVDEELLTAESANFILPPTDDIEPIFFHFKHPVVVNFQFAMITICSTIIESLLKIKQ